MDSRNPGIENKISASTKCPNKEEVLHLNRFTVEHRGKVLALS